MKKILYVVLISAAGYLMFCYTAFSENRVTAFLDRFENDINQGNPVAACDKLSNSIRFSLYDKTKFPPQRISGGKTELCEHFKAVSYHYATALIADRHYKADVFVDRSSKSWSLATVSYSEHHEVEFFPSREKVRTASDEQMTLKRNGTGFTITKWVGETTVEQ